jgi:succinyl-CoA synthetase beta subunit
VYVLEWQAKEVLAAAGVRLPRGKLARTPEEARAVAGEIGGPVMVKAQVPSGGRGKAGGVITAVEPSLAGDAAERLLAQPLLGHRVKRVLVEEALEAEREVYLAVTVDYRAACPVLLVGGAGGVDVDSAARVEIDPLLGWRDYLGRQAMAGAQLAFDGLLEIGRIAYQVFVSQQATLVEINPLLRLADGALVAADARLVLDDAAARPTDVDLAFASDSDSDSDDDNDLTARLKRRHGFDYLELDRDGDIGLITTGAGGTMLTVDLLARRGGRPINFVDVRTGMIGRDPTRLIAVLDELANTPNLRIILVSVFGAITDLAVLSATLLDALAARPPRVPVHVRFQGRNQDEAVKRLTASGIPCHPTLEAAIDAVVGLRGSQDSPRIV